MTIPARPTLGRPPGLLLSGQFQRRLSDIARGSGVVLTAPGAPTGVVGSQGSTYSDVSFTAPASNGGSAIIDYTVTMSPGGATATGTASPITVSGLTNGTAYTPSVTARNTIGSGAAGTGAAVTPTLRNVLTKTEVLDDVIWLKSALAVTANTAVDSVGTTTLDTLTASATANFHFIRQATTVAASTPYTVSMEVKRNNNDWVWFNPYNDGNITWFNLATGLFGTTGAGITASKTLLGNGAYRIVLSGTTPSTALQASIGLSNADAVSTYTAAGTEAVYVGRMQLELASAATTYQRIA